MTPILNRVAFSILVSLPMLALCSETTKALPQPDANATLETRIQALLKKVKRSMRPLKGGTFEMGDWGNEAGVPYDFDKHSRPLHKVSLDGFSMMAYKVTFDDFDVFTDAIGNERITMGEMEIDQRAPNRPVGVSWYGAKAYCQWLGKMTKLPFDLPTEAQWEYAARSGGKKVLFATDNGKLERPRNFPNEREYGDPDIIPDVGSYPPNPAGLYGMSENTGEWVNDWFHEEYYKNSPKKNPTGPESGTEKIMRGSVGGKAEIAAMVFMKAAQVPQTMHTIYPKGIIEGVRVPFPPYAGFKSDNFRCALNSPSDKR
ncbi:formylglycine-generating enzyme family protein [Massilia sp. SYSU DXS3249]